MGKNEDVETAASTIAMCTSDSREDAGMNDQLLVLYIDNELDESQKTEVDRWLRESADARQQLADLLEQRFLLADLYKNNAVEDIPVPQKRVRSTFFTRPHLVAAACLLALLALASHLLMQNHDSTVRQDSPVIVEWSISGNTVALDTKLQGWKHYKARDKVKLSGPCGSVIEVSKDSSFAIPDRGEEQRQLLLHDGMMLSNITPSSHSRPDPFVICTDAGDVRVTGTRFSTRVDRIQQEGSKEMNSTIKVILFAGMLQLINPFGQVAILPGDTACAEEGSAPVRAITDINERFGRHYQPITVDTTPSIPSYNLPLSKDSISNYDYVMGKLKLTEHAMDKISKNGFVNIQWKGDDFVEAYKNIRTDLALPVYVTSDSVLHLYHVQFDKTLKKIEQREFVPQLTILSKGIIDHLLKQTATTKLQQAAISKAIAFYAVGYELLNDYGEEIVALKEYIRILETTKKWSSGTLSKLKKQNESLYHAIAPLLSTGEKSDHTVSDIIELLDKAIVDKNRLAQPLELPGQIRRWVDDAKTAIKQHKGFVQSDIFGYGEDFSQYVPRGHYTRGYDLKRYFVSMMWFGRMTFLIKGGNNALVSAEEARQQTMAACILTRAIRDLKIEGKSAVKIWERIYGVTSFYTGLADDLTWQDYDKAFTMALGDQYNMGMLEDDDKYFEVKVQLAKSIKPGIYSGAGKCEAIRAFHGKPTPEELDKALEKTQGFRFMGQRFIPDSYVMGKLVFPSTGNYTGQRPWTELRTAQMSQAGVIRAFPRGLDVMRLLGSKRACDIMDKTQDSAYQGYDEQFGKLQKQFDAIIEPEGWNGNLYWSWLYAIKGLLGEYHSGYQTYMQGTPWLDKQLIASLGSWSQLRHDTILYAKQSNTLGIFVSVVPKRPWSKFPGYVEPVPEFYVRLLALTRLTHDVLSEMDLLDKEDKKQLASTDGLLTRLLEISKKHLANKALTEKDERWILYFDTYLEESCAGIGCNAMKTTLIADVHTDPNSGQVLEIGTGNVGLVIVANLFPDGNIALSAGPVFSYYEFRHPMADRLTDEKWQKMLNESKDQLKDKQPGFVESYRADLND